MSRYIEARAFDHGEGTLYSGFQQLRRIEDERGTQAAYDQLTRTDVDLHLYGASGRSPYELDATIHAEPCRELRRTWFVIYDHPADRADVGLVAIETDRNQWDGLWTYSTSLIEEVTTHLQNRYH